jgi:hypothetical protein
VRPEGANHQCWLASAYALKDETERAAAELAEARKLDGGDLFASIAHLKAYPGAWLGAPKTRALFEATYWAGLRKAGLRRNEARLGEGAREHWLIEIRGGNGDRLGQRAYQFAVTTSVPATISRTLPDVMPWRRPARRRAYGSNSSGTNRRS